MRIYGFGSTPWPQRSLSTAFVSAASRSSGAAGRNSETQSLQDLLQKVREVGRSLYSLERSANAVVNRRILGRRGAEANTVSVGSGSPLALRDHGTPTTLGSVEEINATPTSFTPFGPAFSNSTALPTVGGVYNGDQGDMLLTFKARSNAGVGNNKLQIDLLDDQGKKIETLNYGSIPPDTELTLSNGLTVALSAGSIQKNDTFQVEVSASVGSVVNPDLPFDGTRNNNPNLEYGFTVSAGSFRVNGETIVVGASDSINSVLDRINSSNAGVTASFDAAGESVQFVQNTPGSDGQIALGNDTSGFLEAMKLNGATATPGLDDERTLVIAQVPALAEIHSGTFSINGVRFHVDIEIDSLNDVMERVNSSEAGAQILYHPVGNLVTIETTEPGESLILDEESSKFFNVLKIVPGTFAPETTSTSNSRRLERRFASSSRFTDQLRALARSVNSMFTSEDSASESDTIKAVHNRFREAIMQTFKLVDDDNIDKKTLLRSGLGIDIDFSAEDGKVMDLDREGLAHAMKHSVGQLERFLLKGSRSTQRDGLIVELSKQVQSIEGQLEGQIAVQSGKGGLLDLFI